MLLERRPLILLNYSVGVEIIIRVWPVGPQNKDNRSSTSTVKKTTEKNAS